MTVILTATYSYSRLFHGTPQELVFDTTYTHTQSDSQFQLRHCDPFPTHLYCPSTIRIELHVFLRNKTFSYYINIFFLCVLTLLLSYVHRLFLSMQTKTYAHIDSERRAQQEKQILFLKQKGRKSDLDKVRTCFFLLCHRTSSSVPVLRVAVPIEALRPLLVHALVVVVKQGLTAGGKETSVSLMVAAGSKY